MTDKKKPKKTGPLPQTVKIEQPWEDAIGAALKKTRPAQGWPDVKPAKKKKTKKPA